MKHRLAIAGIVFAAVTIFASLIGVTVLLWMPGTPEWEIAAANTLMLWSTVAYIVGAASFLADMENF